jgi:hypothetical protein
VAFVSVTRLRIRSLRFLVPFLLATNHSRRQLRAADGFVEGRLTLELPFAFWTMTVWESLEAMRQFRNAAPHLDAMRRLPKWCDEASYVHWEQGVLDVPSIDVAHARLRDEGKISKVSYPTAAHAAGRTAGDRKPRPAPTFRSSQS